MHLSHHYATPLSSLWIKMLNKTHESLLVMMLEGYRERGKLVNAHEAPSRDVSNSLFITKCVESTFKKAYLT